MDKGKSILFLLAVPAIAIAGYGIMLLLVHLFPMAHGSNALYFGVSLAITILGLAIPFWMFKAAFSSAHESDPKEKNFKMKDIPKDKDQLAGHSRVS